MINEIYILVYHHMSPYSVIMSILQFLAINGSVLCVQFMLFISCLLRTIIILGSLQNIIEVVTSQQCLSLL